ncbi:MAG: hypothetical protein JRD89_04540 [Deltaproteobacteria bacterium]|nr:hypothetical protein [Deltaproteobacteria bacterium]
MPVDVREIEFDRIKNLVRGFDWEETERKIDGNTLIITFKKTLPEELAAAAAGPGPEVTGAT